MVCIRRLEITFEKELLYAFEKSSTFSKGTTGLSRSTVIAIKDKDMVNFIISREILQCGLKNYGTKITT